MKCGKIFERGMSVATYNIKCLLFTGYKTKYILMTIKCQFFLLYARNHRVEWLEVTRPCNWTLIQVLTNTSELTALHPLQRMRYISGKKILIEFFLERNTYSPNRPSYILWLMSHTPCGL